MLESKPQKWLMQENSSDEENESYAAGKRQESYSGVWEEKPRLAQPEKRQKTQDWDRVYSYEEKRLKSLIEREEYGNWEKQNRSWEIENGLVPLPEEEERRTIRIFFSPEAHEEAHEEQKKKMKAFEKRLLERCTKVLTEEKKKLEEPYIQKRENSHLSLSKEIFSPFGAGWGLAYHTELPKSSTVQLPPPPLEARQKAALTPEDFQRLRQNWQSTPVISLEVNREKLASEGRCLDGSYLTPYCKCDKRCYKFDTTLEDDRPEYLPIWLAYCRQYRQSHCFDFDDYIGGRVWPLKPSQNFNGRAELMMELANRAIQEYNEKECNVFKYKVMKIEKANYCCGTNSYWMTVKVSNLTLGSAIETFQIHAGILWGTDDRLIFCCRPKEEVIIGLPICEFCFGLLPGEGKEP